LEFPENKILEGGNMSGWTKERLRKISNRELYNLTQDLTLSRFEQQLMMREMAGRFCMALGAGVLRGDEVGVERSEE